MVVLRHGQELAVASCFIVNNLVLHHSKTLIKFLENLASTSMHFFHVNLHTPCFHRGIPAYQISFSFPTFGVTLGIWYIIFPWCAFLLSHSRLLWLGATCLWMFWLLLFCRTAYFDFHVCALFVVILCLHCLLDTNAWECVCWRCILCMNSRSMSTFVFINLFVPWF